MEAATTDLVPVAATAESRREFLERQPTYWLKRCYQALRRKVDAELRPFGLTLSQRDALLSLRHGGPAPIGALSEQLGLEQSSVSRLVDGLARKGLVTVGATSVDRRSRVVSITAPGGTLLTRTPGASELARPLLSQTLSPDEMVQLVEMLRRSTAALEGHSRSSNPRGISGAVDVRRSAVNDQGSMSPRECGGSGGGPSSLCSHDENPTGDFAHTNQAGAHTASKSVTAPEGGQER